MAGVLPTTSSDKYPVILRNFSLTPWDVAFIISNNDSFFRLIKNFFNDGGF